MSYNNNNMTNLKKYLIYNGFSNKLFNEELIIEAKSGADACRQLLNDLNIKYTKIKRSSSNNVKIQVAPFYYNDKGQKISNGIKSWFIIYDGNNIL